MLARIRFVVSPLGADRVHHVNEEDVRVLLSRLPIESYHRLRAVHVNDRSIARRFGYVTHGRREIVLCALPPRMSLRRALVKGQTPELFGARPGTKWPPLAMRRFLLYDVFLHELGHLQMVDETRSSRLRFAGEKLAHEFATEWRDRLWSERFEHADPVHNPPSIEELKALSVLPTALKGQNLSAINERHDQPGQPKEHKG
jgi:hypothetical protein